MSAKNIHTQEEHAFVMALLKRFNIPVADRNRIVSQYAPSKDKPPEAFEGHLLGYLSKDMRLLWAIATIVGGPDLVTPDIIGMGNIRQIAKREIEMLCSDAFWKLVGRRFAGKVDRATHGLVLKSDWGIWAVPQENLPLPSHQDNTILNRIDALCDLLRATEPPRRD